MRIHSASALLIAASLLPACAKERDPIDRTQPNRIAKSMLVGEDLLDPSDDPEFYAQGTLIDVGYGASQSGLFTSTYAQPVSRIKWVIQEKELIGRLTYERIDDSDGKGAGPTSRDGVIAYVYPILSHFDVRRSYNPITGEEQNILEENSSDRPWYEREYMRVDWSQNLNTDSYDFDTLSMIGVFGGVEYESLAYYVNDPTHPDAPHFSEDGTYFDVTNKAFAKPMEVDLSHLGWGIDKFPACFLPADFAGGTDPSGNCNPVELTIRQSFVRVQDHDYEPMEWDGYRFQAYGAFYTERKGYARNYGMSDDKWRRLINRYNIWGQSHAYTDFENRTGEVKCFTPETTPLNADPHRDENNDGTEDECAAVGNGSRCDEFTQKCTLPYKDRPVRPIVWYYTDTSDAEYFDPSAAATQEWDVAMRGAVQTARYTECMRVVKDKAACDRDFPMYFGQQDDNEDAVRLSEEVDACRAGTAYQGEDCNAVADRIGAQRGYSAGVIALAKLDEMVVLCHSPVIDSDHELCGERGLVARIGDLRYHQINVIPTPQTPSPWGIMVDSHDPLTGETIAASVNVWSHVNDLFSQIVVDKLRYINGELSTEEVTEGQYIKDWVTANLAGSGRGLLPKMSRTEIDQRVADFASTTPEALRAARTNLMSNEEFAKKITQLDKQIATVRADAYTAPSAATMYEARRQRALGTELEAALNTDEMRQLSGVTSLPVSQATRFSSPLQGNNPSVQRSLRNLRDLAFAERGACIRNEAPSPTSLTGLGDALQQKFGAFDANQDAAVQTSRAEAMRQYIAHRAHTSVILHEMGHSIGLRHNFVSSSYAWGFRPQYWQLRTKNGTQTTECTDLSATGDDCVGPRWFDPVSNEEHDNMIWMFMQSSVMDYAGEYTQDMMGLGAYDFAAARMFYADAVSVFSDPNYTVGTGPGTAMISQQDNFGGIIGFRYSTDGDTGTNEIHYSQLNRAFNLISDCRSVDPQTFKPANWDDSRFGTWSPLLDGQLVQVNGEWTRCRQQPVDYVNWNQLRPATDDEAGGFSRGGNAVDDSGRVRLPYGFATDRWADLGNLAVYRHDNGADAYELFDFFISEQEVNHIFDNYRRRRQSFSIRGAVNRTLGRYNEKMRDGAKGLGLFANIYRDFSLAEGYDYRTLWPVIVGSAGLGDYNGLSSNVLASGLAFDHFTRQMSRPEPGEHFLPFGDNVLRAANDASGNPTENVLTVPNGVTGYWDSVGFGGRPVGNALADDKGEYDSEYTINAGSYYEKIFSTMLLTESVDNFISDSRRDFTDSRYRAVSMADLFPEGYRRWLANNLTGDDAVKGSWVKANGSGPIVDETTKFPISPIGATTWWTNQAQVCFPEQGTIACSADIAGEIDPEVMPIDPEVGFEQQKFLIAWTLMYLPENQQRWWLDQMSLWSLGEDTDPGFANRIEFHDPTGQVYIAKTYGKETVFGRTVQKGVAARMLEYANELVDAAYETTPGPDLDNDGNPDWFVPTLGTDGQPLVKYDPTVSHITPDGRISPNGRFGCNSASNSECECTNNRACVTLSRYVAVPYFLRTAMRDFGMAQPSMKGIY